MALSSTQIAAYKTELGTILTGLQTKLDQQVFQESLPVVGSGLHSGAGKGLSKIATLKVELDASLGTIASGASEEVVLAKVNEALGKEGFSKTALLTGGGKFEVDFSGVTSVEDEGFSAQVDSHLGLGHLGLTLSEPAPMAAGKLDYDFNFRAGLDGNNNAYVESSGTNFVELDLHLDAGAKGIKTTGTMGFVPYSVSTTAGAPLLDAHIGLALDDGDGHLTAAEAAGNFIIGTILTGEATPSLKLTSNFDTDAIVPKFFSTLGVNWNLAGAEMNPSDDNSSFGEKPVVRVSDVSLDASQFLNALNLGFVDKALTIGGPIFEICDKLSTPLPVVGDILNRFGLGGTLIDVFTGPGSAEAEAVKGISSLGKFLHTVQSLKGGAGVDLGTFTFDSNADIRDPFFSLGAVQPSVLDFGDGLLKTGSLGQLSNAAAGVPGLAFPILQTDGEIFKMVLGQAANLVTYEAAPITFNVSQEIYFPLFFGINGHVGFSASGEIHLGLGYDTSGITTFASSGEASDLLNGFFLKDFGVQGAEIPEATFNAAIVAGVGAGIPGIFEVGVEGGIRGLLNYEFKDFFAGRPDLANDRKVSYGELESVGFNPFAAADISGRIDAFLSFYVESLIYSKSKDLGSITLFDFDTGAAEANSLSKITLAHQNGSELIINTGSNAGDRGAGQTDVAESIRIESAQGALRVSSPKAKNLNGVELAPLGGPLLFKGITEITANGGSGEDVITIGAGVKKPATINGGDHNDALTGGAGNDTISGGDGADKIIGGSGNDKIWGDGFFTGGAGAADVLSGLDGNDRIEGGRGHDEIRGGAGNDTLYGYGTNFGTIDLASDAGDELYGGEGEDTLHGSNSNDVLDGGTGDDMMFGYGGSDTFHVDSPKDQIFSNNKANAIVESTATNFKLPSGFNILLLVGQYDEESGATLQKAISGDGNTGNNFLYGNKAANVLSGNGGNDYFFGDQGDDILIGGDGNDTLEGGDGDDTLFAGEGTNTVRGGNGDDTLFGGTGTDTLEGGAGDDVYVTDNLAEISDTVGNDAIASNVTVNLNDNPSIEGVYLTGSADVDAYGTDGDNLLVGNKGKNHLFGFGGHDSLKGGVGDVLQGGFGGDYYTVDSEKAVIIEVNETPTLFFRDVVFAKSSFTLPDNVEDLQVIGQGAKFGNGNSADNFINANGIAGGRAPQPQALTLDGKAGNDSVSGGDGGDKLYGGDSNDFVFGNFGDDEIYGGRKSGATVGSDNDELYGGVGSDKLFGGSGNDILYGDKSVGGDDTGFPVGEGNDILDGGAGTDTLYGGKGNDRLISDGAGADTMSGGEGDDTYVITGGSFLVVSINEAGAGGVDTVESFADVDLSASFFNSPVITGDVENVRLTESVSFAGGKFIPTGPANASGNALANLITGNSLNNTLDGREGNDTLLGNGGDDTLIGGNGKDVLGGGVGDDTLNGGNFSDEDSLTGGDGSDRYTVFAYDVVVEELKDGDTDTVLTTVNNYQLPKGVENLELASAGQFGLSVGVKKANGNSLSNLITGNGEDNEIAAGLGDDELFGGGGADKLKGQIGNDKLYGEGGGDDMTGGSGDDLLIGGAGIDFLNGGSGKDKLYGYLAGVGLFTAPDDDTADNLSGGNGDDLLDGGGGDDLLDGGEGKDTMIGASGNDIYFVDNKGDKVVEKTDDGIDGVLSGISLTIPANVERLALFGNAPLFAKGNSDGNILIGGDGSNLLEGFNGDDTLVGWRGDDVLHGGVGVDILYGDQGTALIVQADISGFVGSGNDILDGGLGADTMHGQKGDDLYLVDDANDAAIELPREGIDSIRTTLSSFTLPANVENLTYVAKLDTSRNPTPGAVNTSLIGNSLPNHIVGGKGSDFIDGAGGNDLLAGGLGNDAYTVDSINDRIVELPNAGKDIVYSNTSDFTLPVNVENLLLINSAQFGTGNALDNEILGNGLQNGLFGGAGKDKLMGLGDSDFLDGGEGNDYLDGGSGADEMVGGKGDDTFLVDDLGDTTDEGESGGFDTVIVAISNYNLGPAQEIEKLVLLDVSSVLNGLGNSIANIIAGNSFNNFLSGGGGGDTLDGGVGHDELSGTDSNMRGLGEKDVLIGGPGDDFFYLADTSGAFYDDGVASTRGNGDFALIKDFKPADGDRLVFFGEGVDYLFKPTSVTANLGDGMKTYVGLGVFIDQNHDDILNSTGPALDEFIALTQNFLGGGLDVADYAVFLQV